MFCSIKSNISLILMDFNLCLKLTRLLEIVLFLALGFKKELAIDRSLLKETENKICELKVNSTYMTIHVKMNFFSYGSI